MVVGFQRLDECERAEHLAASQPDWKGSAMLRSLLLILFGFVVASGAAAQEVKPQHYSQCQAIAEAVPGAMFARFDGEAVPLIDAAAGEETVRITFLGHSTFYIETPGGVTIATDYSGYHRPSVPPRVVTMNRAHTTHYTLAPDPAIDYVLHGWSDEPGRKAEHHLVLGDTIIRNVTTDIRGMGGFEKDGNSIFIFEAAGLCIGHLGHLHHELSEGHYLEIGRLDVLMVPVDGGLTMGAVSMSRVVQRLRASLILPMHRRGPPVETFLAMFGADYDIKFADSASVTVSLNTLPKKPLIMVLQGL
jgi:L-ascorbate metabolism protein UlaG (beta-lactamase superfamily)